MTEEQTALIEILQAQGLLHRTTDDGFILVYGGGYVELNSLTSFPEGTKFENKGYVYLNSLTS